MRNPNLRLNDLVSRGKKGREESKLMNVKVPANVLARIDRVAANLGATKTEVVIAIRAEGVEAAAQTGGTQRTAVRHQRLRPRAGGQGLVCHPLPGAAACQGLLGPAVGVLSMARSPLGRYGLPSPTGC